MKQVTFLSVALLALAALVAPMPCIADDITIIPTQVPDEEEPRVNVGDFPAGFGADSWQGPASGKTNWHARYLADGDHLSAMFPADAATLTIADVAELSYFTKRPAGTPAGRDWWIIIYTRRENDGNDCSGWYRQRYISNYNDHTDIGNWVRHSTSTGMTFNRNSCGSGPEQTLAELIASNGDDLIEMFSVHTDSGWNGFDGYMDGLEVRLTNGNVGRVNFEAPAGRTTIEIEADPWQVPDEENPRINAGDYPTTFAVDSWQGPLIGKTNWHAGFFPANPSASFLWHMFPVDAPTLTIGDVSEVSYFTKRPAATPANRDWWVQIYTRPTGTGDCSGWYHRRYINNYQDHTDIGNWVEYSTASGMTFRENSCAATGPMSLADLIAADGGDKILMFSVQTDSGWNGYDGFLDGLVVTLNNGNVGKVNFEDVKGGCCTNGPGTESECIIAKQADCELDGGLYLGDQTPCVGALECTPLVVTYESISAKLTRDGVLLNWATATEIDTVGFRVLRETAASAEKGLDIVASFIPAAGQSTRGASYEFLDRSKVARGDVRYWLEDIDAHGRVTRHGPIEVQRGTNGRHSGGSKPANR